VSIGRTGRATPFAKLRPVRIAGSVVGLASLHNEDQVRLKDVRPGDTVRRAQAGDVIPRSSARAQRPAGRGRAVEVPEVVPELRWSPRSSRRRE